MKNAVDDRQMYVLQLLRANPDMTVEELCRKTGVSRATVIHDAYLLRKAGLLHTFICKGERNVAVG